MPPYTVPLLLFRVVGYVYITVNGVAIFGIFHRLQHQDKVLHTRIRWLVLAAITFAGILFFITRMLLFVIAFFYPDFIDTNIAKTMTAILGYVSFLRVGWVFFFIPGQVYRIVARPLIFADKLLALYALQALQAELVSLFPSVAPFDLGHSWQQRWRGLDFHTYRTIISILDGKKKLQGDWANNSNWDKKKRFLYGDLNAVNDNNNFDSLVASYRHIGTQYRKGNTMLAQ